MSEDRRSELIKLELVPEGKLLATWYHYYKDRPINERRVDEVVDVSRNLFCYLFEPIEFHDNLTLGDIFFFLSKNDREFISRLFGHCLMEYVDEALAAKPEESKVVKHLEFFYSYSEGREIWSNKKMLRGEFPQIVGRDNKGQEYALQYLKPGQYRTVPVKLNRKTTISRKDIIVYEYDGAFFNLSNIINGLAHDLGFHGSPKNRDELIALLHERQKNFKEGKSKTYSVEEFMDQLKQNLESLKEKKKE